MGQRLNIEIKNKGQTIANCYYHWSAFTKEALELTKKIIENFDLFDDDNEILKAVKLLSTTGAGLTEESINYMYSNITGFDLNVYIKERCLRKATSRNDGLINLTIDKMKETRVLEEGRVTIDIENKTFNFYVFYYINDIKEINYILARNGGMAIYDELKFNNIPFNQIDNYIDMVDDIFDLGGYFRKGKKIYEIIY